ncbi:Methyltranfer-dom domain-containing protein [Mycena indigotica]|uniref:Methyltranfer-dom domain-containing protein n=1 Tax=Mycena indigotica TaxID=2126181 RepID=A0A8H6W4X8_9AGAR|nr:Methyltranfer-dom domain-containing protein [Mycena indigotica]KAF7299364.1 Methyltranfer-dom domain-containing protein [Mycena indigotica]
MSRLSIWLIFATACILFTFYFIARTHIDPPSLPRITFESHAQSNWTAVFSSPSRLNLTLEGNERRYQEVVRERKAEIQRFGSDKVAFPAPFTEFYTLWDFFVPAFSCPCPVYRVGTLGDGGKWTCCVERALKTNRQSGGCVVYSLGVERQSSFEQEILHADKHCQVFGFDFSVAEFGPELLADAAVNHRAHFFPYKIGGGADNHSATPPEYSLRGIMDELGHDFVDILKVDIEGSEWHALLSLVSAFEGKPLPFGQLLIEIHVGYIAERNSLGSIDEWWSILEDAGLRPFWTEVNLLDVNFLRRGPLVAEWSFLNIRGNHALVDDTLPDYP